MQNWGQNAFKTYILMPSVGPVASCHQTSTSSVHTMSGFKEKF